MIAVIKPVNRAVLKKLIGRLQGSMVKFWFRGFAIHLTGMAECLPL